MLTREKERDEGEGFLPFLGLSGGRRRILLRVIRLGLFRFAC